jgi:tRNA-specific 2-thiouridylase
MSGGVDSAVAAARVLDAGHEVTGVHLALANVAPNPAARGGGCCTPDDVRDAGRVADRLGIPFYVWDMSEPFHEAVVSDFVAQYAAGRTPNPCLRCNEKIKFAAVLDRAVALGFDAVVTGHHARLGADGLLRRSVDPRKDQSYVLAGLTGWQLARSMFPLGFSTKAEVRDEAAHRGLTVASKPDSHDICFIPDGDTRGFLAQRLGAAPGEIIDAGSGEVLGRHDGAHAFTIGQRRGLDLRVAAADRKPRYVLAVAPDTNTVTVGPAEALDVTVIHAASAIWPGGGGTISYPVTVACQVQVRAHGKTVPAEVTVAGDGRLTARLRVPARGVAPGQAIVAYREDDEGDVVLGAATITRAGRS